MATLLIVDDVELFRELERAFLEAAGHRVVTAASGEEALALVEREAPDLVLLDLHMPGMGGEEVCRRLRRSSAAGRPPVIMVTAAGGEGQVRRCLEAGCDDYVTKPINRQLLLEKVDRLLGKERARADRHMPRAESRDLGQENRRLRQRVAELEEENRGFAEQLVAIEEANNNLTNLYIASSRLHSVLDRKRVTQIIQEVVINFVGAEKFALLERRKGEELVFAAGEGFDEGDFPEIPPGREPFAGVLNGGESYFSPDRAATGSDDPLQPLAVIPLRIRERVMGLLAVYRLFAQKQRFEAVDFQLFELLAEHAATALFASSLYEESERKRETYKGFMDLLLK